MRWIRDAGWLVALGIGIVFIVMRPERKPLPDPKDTTALIEKHKAEFAERQAARAMEIGKIKTDGTLSQLKILGRSYASLSKLATETPGHDAKEGMDIWRSSRDDKPFVIVWGVDLAKLPGGGAGHVLAWEQTADAAGTRCVLLADGKTAKAIPDDEFQKLPKAK